MGCLAAGILLVGVCLSACTLRAKLSAAALVDWSGSRGKEGRSRRLRWGVFADSGSGGGNGVLRRPHLPGLQKQMRLQGAKDSFSEGVFRALTESLLLKPAGIHSAGVAFQTVEEEPLCNKKRIPLTRTGSLDVLVEKGSARRPASSFRAL